MAVLLGLIALLVAIGLARRQSRLEGLVRLQQPDRVGEALAARVRALEQRLDARERRAPAGAPSPLDETSVPPAEPAAIPPMPEPAPAAGGLDLETRIAGRWLNGIGILALLFAAAFFLKYAFDNDWFGPRMRVGIGLVVGAALVASSRSFLVRGYRYFSEGIAGLGGAVLFLSIYAAWSYYRLCTLPAAFASLAAVSGVLGRLAVGRDSERVALVAMVGGFLTPALLLSPFEQPAVLFTYLGVLDTAILLLGEMRRWRSVVPVGFAATQFFFWRWYAEGYTPTALVPTTCFTLLFHALFAAPVVLRSARSAGVERDDVLLVLLDAGAVLLILRQILWPDHRGAFACVVLGLGAAYLAVSRATPARETAETVPPRDLFGGLALAFGTLAIFVWLEGRWATVAFATEGLALVWSGFASRVRWLRNAGEGLLAFAVWRLVAPDLLADHVAVAHLFWNARFAACVVVIGCIAVAVARASADREGLATDEVEAFAALAIVGSGLGLFALSFETWDALGRMAVSGLPAQQLGLSLLWTGYASVLIGLGVRRGSAPLRWQALALFAVVIGKVFLLDLSSLERGYRIASFVVLGLVLVAVSFLYQRAQSNSTSSAAR